MEQIKIIDDFTSETIEAISRLEFENFGSGGLNRWHLPFIFRYGKLYTAEIDGQIIGAAELIRGWNNKSAYLVGLSVNKKKRSRGIGKRLMEKMIDDLKSDDLENFDLTVDLNNKPAVKLYRSLGFINVKDLPEEYGPGEDRILMRLDLRDK